MSIKARLTGLATILILVVSLAKLPVSAQEGEIQYFPETGHNIRGEFLAKFQSATNPIKLFGYPITEAYEEPASSPEAGLLVQYFQRARFEYHPENPPSHRILISPLGKYLYDPKDMQPLGSLPANHPACRAFPETGYQVCYAFLSFFNANGGTGQFGNPISNQVRVNDRIMQYFERARFEWHPEMPPGQRVSLTDLGRMYFSLHEDPVLLLPPKANNAIPSPILNLQVRAFPVNAVMPDTGNQTVYVIVQDQQLKPVPNAQVILTVLLPSHQELKLLMPLTNKDGISRVSFSQKDQPVGIAQILVEVNLNNQFQKQTRTSYRIW